MTDHARQFLSASTRRGRDVLEDDDELAAAKLPARDPGKRSDEDELGPPARDPGKRSRVGDGTAEMSPAHAVAFADWMTRAHRIDRRAETSIADEAGALSTAFEFLAEARGGQALPDELRRRLERELGVPLAAVRVHTDDRAAAAAAALGARAFTVGDDIYFAAGAYDPTGEAGQALIAHEVAHVAQHRLGSAPTARKLSRPDDAHERDAERFATRFATARPPGPGDDPARLVEYARRNARRIEMPFLADLEDHFGTSFDFVEVYTGRAAELACQAMSAAAFAVQNLVMLADPSPKRALLLHELTHVLQAGKRRAPERFALGTLTVSDRRDPAEVEARRGGSAQATASPSTIYRGSPEDEVVSGESEPQTVRRQQARINFFVAHADIQEFPQTLEGHNGDVYAFGKPNADETEIYRYKLSSRIPWKANDYAFVIEQGIKDGLLSEDLRATRPSDGRVPRTYQNDIAAMLDSREDYGIAQVNDRGSFPGGESGDESSSKRYAFVLDEEENAYAPVVWYIHPDAGRRPDPESRMRTYREVVVALQGLSPPRCRNFVWERDQQLTASAAPLSDFEADAYLAALQAAVVDEYAELDNSWDIFFDEIIDSAVFPRGLHAAVGSIFEDLVRRTSGLVLGDRPIFVFNEGTTDEYRRIGDASFEGEIIVDAKATSDGITSDYNVSQLRDYDIITRPGVDDNDRIKGYFRGQGIAERRVYRGVLYIVATVEVANLVKAQIERLVPDRPWDRFSILPAPDGDVEIHVTANPTFRFQAEDNGGTSYSFTDPPSQVPGVSIHAAQFTLEAESHRIASGSLEMDLDMGGAFTGENVTKTVTPTPSEGVPTGRVENRFSNFTSSLDQILSAVTVDAHLIDGGIEATIALQPGAVQIPQFTIDTASLTARYTDAGLEVSGEVAVSHTSGNITGRVSVGWDGNQWTLDGQATLQEGLIDGLSEVTLGIRYEDGRTSITCEQATYEHQLGAVLLTGTVTGLAYDLDAGAFSGEASLTADLGMFGTATAEVTIANNELASASFSYDSPELRYPAGSEDPVIAGSIGGTIAYADGAFSGAITGSANLVIPALQAVAGDAGIGLTVDAQFAADGTCSGTIATTTPLTLGDHLEVPSLSCTINPDGSLTGAFALRVVNVRYVDNAEIACTVDATGVHISSAGVTVPFGSQGQGQFWGTLTAGYSEATGLAIGGDVSYQIKEGMVAHGAMTYDSATSEVSLDATVDEITLLDTTVSRTLFSATKQIPIFSAGVVGVYLDLGFDLGFDFGFQLGVQPTVEFEGLSLEDFSFTRIAASLELLGEIYARLTGTPRLGIGVFALAPFILRGGGGITIPIVGDARITPSGRVSLGYTPGGGVEGEATVGMAMTFGITGSVAPYAQLSVLDGMFSPSWEGDALGTFEILPPRELFNFTIDFAGDMTAQTPALPETNQAPAPSAPTAGMVLPEEHGAETQTSGPPANVAAEGPTAVNETGDEGPFGLSALAPLLQALPGVAPIQSILDKAGQVWNQIGETFGRVVNAFRSFFAGLADQMLEILDGFATQGVGYLPTLIQRIVGDDVYEIIEPLIVYISGTADKLLEIFELHPPTDLANLMPWVWTVVGQVVNIAAGSLTGFVDAIREMLSNLRDFTCRLMTRAVDDGWIGVKRHVWYIPIVGPTFLAASEFKLNIPGTLDLGHQRQYDFLLTPTGAVASTLYTVIEELGVPPTYTGWSDEAGEAYNDRWRGDGERG
jgi:hypothetical protein